MIAGVASAQRSNVGAANVTDFKGTLDANQVKVISFDQRWIVQGLIIYDNKTNEPVFRWSDSDAIRHEGITVSWSPDSQRVVILDQMGRAPEFYCAQLENGQWHVANISSDPKEPKLARVTKAEIGNWVSPTSLQIKERHLVDRPPSPTPEWVEYTTTLNFEGGDVNYAAKQKKNEGRAISCGHAPFLSGPEGKGVSQQSTNPSL